MANDSKKKIIYDRGGEENRSGLTIHWMNQKQLKKAAYHPKFALSLSSTSETSTASAANTIDDQALAISKLQNELELSKKSLKDILEHIKLKLAQVDHLERDKSALMTTYQNDVDAFQDTIQSLQGEVAVYEKKCLNAEAAISSLEVSRKDMEHDLTKQLEQSKTSYAQMIGRLEEQLDNQRTSSWCDIKLKNEEVQEWKKLNTSLASSIIEKDSKIQTMTNQLATSKSLFAKLSKELEKTLSMKQEQINRLTTVVEEATRKYNKQREALQLLKVEHKSKSDEVQSLNLQAHKYNKEINDVMMQGKFLQDKNISLTERYERQLTKMNDTLASKELKIDEQREAYECLQQIVRSLETKINTMKSKQEEIVTSLEGDVTAKEKAVEQLKVEVDQLTNTDASLTSELEQSSITTNTMQDRIDVLEQQLQQAANDEVAKNDTTNDDNISALLSSEDEGAKDKNTTAEAEATTTSAMPASQEKKTTPRNDKGQSKRTPIALSDISNRQNILGSVTKQLLGTEKPNSKASLLADNNEVGISSSFLTRELQCEYFEHDKKNDHQDVSPAGQKEHSNKAASSDSILATATLPWQQIPSPKVDGKENSTTSHNDNANPGLGRLSKDRDQENEPKTAADAPKKGQTERKRKSPAKKGPLIEKRRRLKRQSVKEYMTSMSSSGCNRHPLQGVHTDQASPISVGDIGYKFKKYFFGKGWNQWYNGEVVDILKDNKYHRHCKYDDGSTEDYTLSYMKQYCKPRD